MINQVRQYDNSDYKNKQKANDTMQKTEKNLK